MWATDSEPYARSKPYVEYCYELIKIEKGEEK